MLIRPERPSDVAEISSLTYGAFLNHPQHAPGALPTEHKIVDALREAGALTLSLVAKDEGVLVGHVAFSPVKVNGEDRGWFGLGPVSVLPARQRQGVGSALIRKGLELLREQGAKGCMLVGDPAYYSRFGFRPSPELTLDGVPPEVFLCLPLEGDVPTGVAVFHEAFGAH